MGIGIDMANIRKRLNLSHMDITVKTRFDKSYLSRIENEHLSPTVKTVEKILKSFGYKLAIVPDSDNLLESH